jgi:hypothetical protein
MQARPDTIPARSDLSFLVNPRRVWGIPRLSWLHQWVQRWELWLCLAVGAWLRLADLRHTLFLNDQVSLLQVGQAAMRDGGLPITGIPSSLGTLNTPFSIYLYLPFAALGSPFAATWMIALANLMALMLTYVVVDRTFGRLAAGVTLALYATSAYAVLYSSYFWQQTAVAPFLLVYLLTLYAGVVQKRKRWLVVHLVSLGLLSQLHPITTYLIPTTLVGLVLLWPRIPWRDLAIGLFCIGLFYVPTLIWGVMSNWADMQVLLRHFFAMPSTYDLLALDQLLAVLRLEGVLPFGVNAAWLGWLMDGAYLLALGWLGCRVAAPLVQAFRGMRIERAEALWRLRENAGWRGELLLFIWQVAPLLLLIHRTQGYCQCYMVLFFPAPYITLGLALAWVFQRERKLFRGKVALRRRGTRLRESLAGSWQDAPGNTRHGTFWRAGVVSSLALLLLLQTFSSSHLTLAYRGLDTEEASLSVGQREARVIGATQTIVASSLFLHGAFAYLAEQVPGVVEAQSAESCLALPTPASLPTVVVTAFDQQNSMADAVLGALPAATLLKTLPVRDLPPDHLYRVDSSDLRLATEQALPQPLIADQHLALEGMASLPAAQGLVVLRWRVLQTYPQPTGPGVSPLSLLLRLQPVPGFGEGLGAAETALCTLERMQVGETLLAWFATSGVAPASEDGVPLVNLSAQIVVTQRVEPVVGPLRFVTGAMSTKVSPPLPLLCRPDQPAQPSCQLTLPS